MQTKLSSFKLIFKQPRLGGSLSKMLLPPSQIISHFNNLRELKHLKFDQIYMINNNIYDTN